MTLFAFSIQIGLSLMGTVLLVNLTNLVLQSSLVFLHRGTEPVGFTS